MGEPLEEPLQQRTFRSARRPAGFWKRTGAIATSMATAVGMTLAGAMPATADDGEHRSHARGHLINADLLGLDLADVGTAEQNFLEYGGEPVQGQIDAAVLDELLSLELGGISLPILGDGLEVGAVSSYAHTPSPGEATASAGVITQDGAIDVSGSDGDPYGYATVNLTNALGQLGLNLDGVVDELGLQLGAIASTATATNGEVDSEYAIAGARLALDSPLVDDITTILTGAVGGLDETVNSALGEDGPVQAALDGLSYANVTIPLVASVDLGSPQLQVEVGLQDAVAPLLEEPLVSDSGVTTIDLEQGEIYLDLEALHADGLNDLDPNTPLLSSDEITQITGEVSDLLGELLTTVTTSLEELLGNTSVTVELTPEVSVLAGLASTNIGVEIDTTLAGLLGGGDDVDEDAIRISGDLSVIGIDLPVGGLLDSLLGPILNNVLPSITGPLVSELGNVGDLVSGALSGVLDPVLEGLSPVLESLNEVATITVNSQSEPGELGEGSFSVSALELEVLPSVSAVALPLATSSVYAENAADYNPTVELDPDEGQPEDTVDVIGGDFVPGSTVTISVSDEAGDQVGDEIEVTIENDDGSFTAPWQIPADTTPGELTVDVTDNDNPDINAQAPLTVLEATVADVVIESPADGATVTDDPVVVSGTAEPGVTVEVTLAGQTESVTADEETGEWSASFPGVEPGEVTATATDENSTDSVTFTISADDADDDTDATDAVDGTDADATDADATDAVDADAADADAVDTDAVDTDADATDAVDGTDADAIDADATDGGDDDAGYKANVLVDPTEVEAGNTVTVTGDDFAPNSTVDVVITDEEGTEVETIDGVEVSNDGEFTTEWDVPVDASAGTYTVTATDTEDTDITGSAWVVVTDADESPELSVDPDRAEVGQEVTFTGSGYAPNSEITLEANPSIEGVTSDSEGEFEVDWVVADELGIGEHVFTGTDELGGEAQTVLTVIETADADADGSDNGDSDSSVSVDPEDANPGQDVTIEGEDFEPGETVIIEITDEDGNVIDTIDDVVTDENGNFTVTWTIPEDMDPGVLTITATDESGKSASAELTVKEPAGAAAGAADAGSDDGLASTGATTTIIATAIAVLLIAIGMALLIARRNNKVQELN